MRSLLGFRPPHFSEEEEAWLPAWLHPLDSPPPAHPSEKSGRLSQSIRPGENGNLPDVATCKSLLLFLSGDDNSPSCSTNHEAQYHLHLSSVEESQYSLNPTLSRSQADKSELNQALPVRKQAERVIPEKGEACVVPSQQKGDLGIAGSKSPSFKEQKELNSKVNTRCQNADISDAIELAVAASEALTIHQVLKDEILIASSVLEAAIRLNQARLENFKENLSNSCQEGDEVDFDFLSDVDDLTMADAYEDVGLTVASHGDPSGYCSVSHVNDSFASENCTSNAKRKGNERGGLQVDSGCISTKQHKQVNNATILSKGSTLESCECVTRKVHGDHKSVGIENTDLACDVDPVFDYSVEQTDFCAAELSVRLQKEGFTIEDQTISKSNERQDMMTNLVRDRFQSRWFGGWTWKNEVSIPAVTDDIHVRTVPELFAIETSSLSESADVPPDMGSCMNRQDIDKTVPQSSVAPECAYTKANDNGNLISDDVAMSFNDSPMDPLCSVVPCSFTTDSVVSQNSEHQVNLEKCVDPKVKPNLDNLEVNGESLVAIRRQVTSLKTYSILNPRCEPYLDKERTRGKPPFEHNPTAKVDTVLASQTEKNGKSSSFEPNQTAKVDTALTSQRKKDGESSSFEHNQTAKADTALTSQREKDGESSSFNQTAKVDTALNCQRDETRKVESIVPRRKRVRFSETEIFYPQVKKFQKTPPTRFKDHSVAVRIRRRLTQSKTRPCEEDNKTLFQDLKFLVTGFSVKKHKQIKIIIQKSGGVVLDDIPSLSTSRTKRCLRLPLILCPKKLLTTKFLYGCAVNASILNVSWLFDSVEGGSILPHQRYKILKDCASKKGRIFDDIAIMLHGKQDFCSKMAKVIKHGGGSVFKTFHWLVKSLDSKKVSAGVIVVEDESGISRQLKQCAVEQNVPVMPFSWMINSLYAGMLLPSPQLELPDHLISVELSEEI